MATDQDVSVVISANAADLQAGLMEAQKAVAAAVAEMAKQMKGLSTGTQEAQKEVVAAVTEMGKQMKAESEKTAKEMEKVKESLEMANVLHTANLVLHGFAKVKDAVMKVIGPTLEWTRATQRLATQLGITTEEASALKVALETTGVAQETYNAAVGAMSRNIAAGGENLAAFGIAVEDSNGHLRDTRDVLQDTIDRLNKMPAGTARNAAGTKIFGRAWSETQGVLKLSSAAMEEAYAKADQLGLTVSKSMVDAQKKWDQSMRDSQLALKGVAVTIGEALLPAIGDLIRDITGGAFSGRSTLKLWSQEVADGMIKCSMATAELGAAVIMVKNIMTLAMSPRQARDWFDEQIKMIDKVRQQRLMQVWSPTALTDTSKEHLDALREAERKAREDEERERRKREKGTGGAGAKSQMPEWNMRYKEMQAALAREAETRGVYYTTGIQEELNYWKTILATEAKSADERMAVESKIMDLEAALRAKRQSEAEAAAADAITIEKGKQDTLTMMRLAALDDERGELDHRVNMNQMTAEQRIEAERTLIEREQAIRRAALNEQLADDALTVVQRESLYNQLVELDIDFQNRLAENARRAAEQQGQVWQSLGDSMRNSMASTMVDLINGVKSWSEATKALMNEILQSFIQMLAKQLTQHITMENAKLLWTKLTTKQEVESEAEGAVESKAISISKGTTEIATDGATGFAAAYKAMVGIPYVGPFIAPALAAAAMAAILSMKGKLTSAAGGYWDVPHDQLAQIHKNEMVLPAAHSERLRGLLEGGEDGGLGGGGGSTTINVHALDARSFDRYLRSNSDSVVRLLKSQSRNYAFQQG